MALVDERIAAKEHKERMEEWSKLGLGLFIHWGVYAAWDGKYQGLNELGETVNVNITYNAEWLLCRSKMPVETYKSKSNYFTGELWNAEEIAKMAYQAGMKYIVIMKDLVYFLMKIVVGILMILHAETLFYKSLKTLVRNMV